MSERQSQTVQRYVDALQIANAKIGQLQAQIQAVRDIPWAPSTSDQTITTAAWVDGYNAAIRTVWNALDGDV